MEVELPVRRRLTLEESDDQYDEQQDGYEDASEFDGSGALGGDDGRGRDGGGSPGQEGFSPGDHPWDYNDGAKAKIADIILMPDRDKLREFTKIPQGILFDMCLGDVMVEAMEQYNNPKFNAAGYLMKIIDQRLRAHDGWIAKLATVLAGDEARGEEVNPMQGPQI